MLANFDESAAVVEVPARLPARTARWLLACLAAVLALPVAIAGEASPARTVELSLAVDETPPVLAVTRSAVTTVTFLDAAGRPWPIAALHVSAGAPAAAREPTHPHVATLRTEARNAAGNVVAFLDGLDEPVHLAVARDAPAASRLRVTVARPRGWAESAASEAHPHPHPPVADSVGDLVREYLAANPDAVAEATDPAPRLASAAFRLRSEVAGQAGVPAGGDLSGEVTVVEFFDYACGYCRSSHDAAKAAMALPGVRVEFREYPILGEASRRAARLALAADLQGRYLEAHAALMSWPGDLGAEDLPEALASVVGLDAVRLRGDMELPAVSARIEANRRLGARLGISGTPAFLVLGPDAAKASPGALDATRLADLVEAVEG